MTDRFQNGSADGHLEHFGIKGMKWGVRRSEAQLKAARGKTSEDAAKAEAIAAKIKESGGKTSSLTNAEMQTLINRKNLELNYSQMLAKEAKMKKEKSKLYRGKKKADEILGYASTAGKLGKGGAKVGKYGYKYYGKGQMKRWDWKKDIAG